jgi:hypothetical protein
MTDLPNLVQLAERVLAMARQKNVTLVTAESCTAGKLSALLSEAPGDFADYLCHRAASIETTSGWKESLLHLLQIGEIAIPTLAAIFLEINALVIAIMIVCLIAHEATAIWAVSYAYHRREVTPTEQHVHSFLEMLSLVVLFEVLPYLEELIRGLTRQR